MAGFNYHSILSMGTAALMLIGWAVPALAQRAPRGARPMQVRQRPSTQANGATQQSMSLRRLLLAMAELQVARTGSNSQGYGGSYSAPYMAMMSPYQNQMYSSTNNRDQAQSYSSFSGDSAAKDSETVLTALGLRVKNGHLDWPLALVALSPGEEVDNLRRQLESLVLVMSRRSSAGKPNTGLEKEARQALDRLQSLSYSNRFSMTLGTRKEAERFLDQLDNALQVVHKY
jgi:hypothetical protein